MTTADVQNQIRSSAAKYGVDPSLALAVAKVESGFQPSVVSSAGAIGTMQLMPGTAASLGVDPNDPTQNIDGGVKLLSQLLNQYGGDVTKALWAYNAGPGNVAKGIKPAETQAYIPAVLNAQGLFDTSLPVDLTGSLLTDPDVTGFNDAGDVVTIAGMDIPASYILGGSVVLGALLVWKMLR